MKLNKEDATVEELFELYAEVTAELRTRKISSDSHDLLFGYSQLLVCKSLGLLPTSDESAGYDATDAKKNRYLIRACRSNKDKPSPELATIRDFGSFDFDLLVALVFDPKLKVQAALQIPISVVKTECSFLQLAKTDKFVLRNALLKMPKVTDIIEDISKAESVVLRRQGKPAKGLAKAASSRQ